MREIMGVRRRLYHPEEVRAKIKTSQIVNRLINFINGKIELSPHQVSAALGLIKKTMPDLQAIENTHKGDSAHPLVISQREGNL
jgi:hypothetical protein